MSYTPINWQTGDTITAEKMNKMDNGWGAQETQLFSESVTTADAGGMNMGTLVYSDTIDADSILVTFNGTDYTCPRIDAFGAYFYGGFTEQGPDFSEYPFAIQSREGSNTVYTESAGTYTMSANANVIVVSDSFSEAIALASPASPLFQITLNETTWQEAHDAMASGKLCYYTALVNGDHVEQFVALTADYNTNQERYEIGAVGVPVDTLAVSDVIYASSSNGALIRN